MLPSNPREEFLDLLNSYGTFMESIDTLCDMGSGMGEDLEWWATRAVLDDDDNEIPLNIKCTGVDLHSNKSSLVAQRYDNVVFENRDFENAVTSDKRYDVIWCNNSFQYCVNPFETLKTWREMMTAGGMLAMIVPATTYVENNRTVITQGAHTLFHYTTVSLIHILAMAGFDVAFMNQPLGDPWIKVVAYKSKHGPYDPKTTSMYDLMGKQLFPHAAEECVHNYGYLRQDALTLPWLDKTLRWHGND